MRFTRKVYDEIVSSPIGSGIPEQGGALFSSDGGLTIDKFIFDDKGSWSGVTYSPNVNFINDQIKRLGNEGYYFIGIIHSHPAGCTAISMGRGRGFGYTGSDEEAIIKLLSCMKGTKRLYFPVVQSSVNGRFSMRVFYGEKNNNGTVIIGEDCSIVIVEKDASNAIRREIKAHLPINRYSHSTAIIFGAGNGIELAEGLCRSGVSKFIIVDGTRFELSDMRKDARYDEVGTYKADVVARRIFAVNPVANIKIIRQYVDCSVTKSDFSSWLNNVDRRKSIVVYCEGGKDDFGIVKRLCSEYGISLLTGCTRKGYYDSAYETFLFDFWATPSAAGKREVDCFKHHYDANFLNFVLCDKVLSFFQSSSDKHRRDKVKSLTAELPVVNKYELLYTKDEISKKKVIIIGCGGSRSYAENLARSGVRHFLLIDADIYGKTNLQTQMAYEDELGASKVEVIADRIRMINPDAEVICGKAMLDENMSDEQFAALIGEDWLARPNDVLLAACTDNVIAQERCSRLALKYGLPFIMAGIYPGGRIIEIIFFHPETSKVCPRCMIDKRIKANLSVDRPLPAVSNGTPIFITEQLNAYKGFISLALLLYHSETADKRFADFMDDNKWTTPIRGRKIDRNFMFLTMDARMAEHSGRAAYAQFDRWGQMGGTNFFIGGAFFRKKKPLHGCPDCGGRGKPLIAHKGKMKDTREGLYS